MIPCFPVFPARRVRVGAVFVPAPREGGRGTPAGSGGSPSQGRASQAQLAPAGLVSKTRTAVLLPLALAGCLSAAEQRADADAEVYALLAERRADFVADPSGFTIDPDSQSLAAAFATGQADANQPLGPFTLAEALELAGAQDSAVQTRKERLYTVALDLTLQRFLFRNNRFVAGGADLDGEGLEADQAGFDAAAGFSRVIGTGGTVLANIGVSLFRGLLSSDDWDPVGNIGLSITQPLLQGYGRQIVFEPLTQAERNLLYEVRSYERFRRTFAFAVADDYLRILQSYDALRNAQSNYDGLVQLRERNEALASAGRLSDIQVDQARQNELNAQSNVINAVQLIQGQLDDFKDVLGLPLSLDLLLDQEELTRLREMGVEPIELEPSAAIRMALENRYDYQNALAAIVDAERRAKIAADALRTTLDLTVDLDAASEPGQPLEFSSSNVDWSIGLELDLPIDRIVERNAYRASLITLQAVTRAANDLKQVIGIAIRDALRELEARRQDYDIQRNSVLLAERRVESTTLNFEAGRAQTR
ncbi:MAG: TolC family protein, partial [Planctomycetota bacterium]